MQAKPPPSDPREAYRYLVLSSQILGSLLGLVLLGYGLDRYLGTGPWLILIGAVLGVLSALWQLVRLMLREPPSGRSDAG
ncbi:MAG: AtpZ/AtpI family protein [Bacteroidetes bacterium]|nr:AtpZ/AtpI family protein [Rhodothermia bacterium]MCX7907647.1 AtpZ/AtpI family protein [Bacteroidota bacterium]MDW8286373.1 AtpZ/AtpI family protein [Bacteroidota bacterium]